MFKILRQKHGDIDLVSLQLMKKVDGIFSYMANRVIVTGHPQITLMTNSYKYVDQLQFKLYSHKSNSPIKVEKRNDSWWNVLEIDLPLKEGKELLKRMLKLIEVVEDETRNDQTNKTIG